MGNLLEDIGQAVSYDDLNFHQFLQDRFGSDPPSAPNPPLTIPEFNEFDPAQNTPLKIYLILTPQPLRMLFLQVKVKNKSR